MQLIRYGTIGVTVAAAITGALWYARDRPAPHIEDIAWLRSNTHVRSELWDALDNDLPGFGTNVFVGVHGLWTSLYTEAMSGARLLATNVVRRAEIGNDGITVMWAAGALSNGMSIAGADVAWAATTNYGYNLSDSLKPYWLVEWRRQDPTNVFERAYSTASIMAGDNDLILPYTPTQRMPVAAATYGIYAPLKSDADVHGGTSNWWSVRNVHTNIYGYSCELWTGLVEKATLQSVGGSSWTLDPAAIRLIGQAPRSFSATDAVSTRSRYQAAALRLDTDLGSAYAVAYALPVYDPSELQFVEFDDPTATLPEASTIQAAFRVRAARAPMPGAPVAFKVTNVTPSTLESVTPAWLWFSNTNWSVWQDVYVNTGIAADGIDRAGIVRVGPVNFAALRVLSASGTPPPVKITPFFAEAVQNGSVSLAAQITTNIAPAVAYNQRIRTNNLNEARAVLDGLNRTWAVIDTASSYFNATSVVTTVYGGDTNFPVLYDDGFYAPADVYAWYQSAYSNVYSSFVPGEPLLDVWASAKIESYDHDDPAIGTSSSAEAFLAVEYNDWLGCSATYPSLYAITNGFVGTIRYYGVFSSATGEPIITAYDQNATNIISFTADETYPDKYESLLYGVVSAVRHRPDNPAMLFPDPVMPITNSYFTVVERQGNYDRHYVDCPVVLLAENTCTNATGRPTFDIVAPRMAGYAVAPNDHQVWSVSYRKQYSDADHTDTLIKFRQSIILEQIIVEVDWLWPAITETNTPPWAL